MKRYAYALLLIASLLGAALLWTTGFSAPTAQAAVDPHEGHDHGPVPDGHGEDEDLDALFEEESPEEQDDHSGHDHAPKKSAHEGHDHGGDGKEGESCPEHRIAEVEDALCHGDHIAELGIGEGMFVRLASPEVAGKAGIGISTPRRLNLAAGTSLPGRVEFNRNRLSRIAPLSSGLVREVLVRPGQAVRRGEVLAKISMPEVASLKAQLLAAKARHEQAEAAYLREKDLLERGISSRLEFQQAEAEARSIGSSLSQYRQQLGDFGLSPQDIDALLRGENSGALVALRAPFAGTVTSVATAAGETATPGSPLFTLADLETLWIELAIPESGIGLVKTGMAIEARFDGLPGEVFKGQVFQLGAEVDERARTLNALAEVKNPDQLLRAGMFGEVRLLAGGEKLVLTVPADAVQTIDGLTFLFLRKEPDLFELRRVRAGAKVDGTLPILAGLRGGEQVVTSQGFALKSEVLKARLGASCADH